jgi:hypothetical protein
VLKHVLALFEAFPNIKSAFGMKLWSKLRFWYLVKKPTFWTILPYMRALKQRFGAF